MVHRDFRTLLLIATLGLVLASGGRAFADEPAAIELTRAEGAMRPGERATVTFFGEVGSIETLWIDADVTGIQPSFTKGQPGNGQASFAIELPAEAAVGVAAVRAVGAGEAGSVSRPLLVMIDDLPSVSRRHDAGAGEHAQRIEPPVAVDGYVPDSTVQQFRFDAQAGQRVTIDVVARRLGSRLDPLLRLLDHDGRTLATSTDALGLHGDCRLTHTFDADGEYLIELRDTVYDGGEAYGYRMRVGSLPEAVTVMPPGVRAGVETEVRFVSPAGEAALPPQRVKADGERRRVRVSARGAGHEGSTFASVIVDDLPHVLADPPGADGASATAVELPGVIVSRFTQADRPHVYRLEAKAGQRLGLAIHTDALHSPANVLPRLYDGEGNRLARPDDPGWPDSGFTHTFEDEGAYELRVDELHYAASPGHVYRIGLLANPPRFKLAANRDTLNVRQGGSATLKVERERAGYDGPVEIEAATPDGLTVEVTGGRFDDDNDEREVTLTVAADAPTGLHFIELIGRAAADDADDRAPVSTRPALQEHFHTRHVLAELDGRIALYIAPAPEPEDAEEEGKGEDEDEQKADADAVEQEEAR